MNVRKAMNALLSVDEKLTEAILALKTICEDTNTSIDDLCQGLKSSTELVRHSCATELYKRTGRPRARNTLIPLCTDFNEWTHWLNCDELKTPNLMY